MPTTSRAHRASSLADLLIAGMVIVLFLPATPCLAQEQEKAQPKSGKTLAETTIPAGSTPIAGVELFLTEAGYTVVLPAKLVHERTFAIDFDKGLIGFSLIDLKHVFDKNGFEFYYDDKIEHRPLDKSGSTHSANKKSFTSGKIPLRDVRKFVVEHGWIFVMSKSENQDKLVRLIADDDVNDRDVRNLVRRCGYLAKYKKEERKKPQRRDEESR